jgi:hypothetical protein
MIMSIFKTVGILGVGAGIGAGLPSSMHLKVGSN